MTVKKRKNKQCILYQRCNAAIKLCQTVVAALECLKSIKASLGWCLKKICWRVLASSAQPMWHHLQNAFISLEDLFPIWQIVSWCGHNKMQWCHQGRKVSACTVHWRRLKRLKWNSPAMNVYCDRCEVFIFDYSIDLKTYKTASNSLLFLVTTAQCHPFISLLRLKSDINLLLL